MRVSCIFTVCLLGLFLAAQSAFAQTGLKPEDEARAKLLFKELRCVVCQNQSIGDSDADVAKDLREIVREQMAAGKSEQEIKTFLVERYGEFILLKPVFAWHTLLLWLGPILLVLLGVFAIIRAVRRQTESGISPLTQDEEKALSEIIERKTES